MQVQLAYTPMLHAEPFGSDDGYRRRREGRQAFQQKPVRLYVDGVLDVSIF